MSTLEAMAAALAFLGHATEAARLLALHAAAVEQASRLRGMPAAIG
jgi:DNA-binding transcriptional regulator YdaS (Cro superfamily)